MGPRGARAVWRGHTSVGPDEDHDEALENVETGGLRKEGGTRSSDEGFEV